MDRTIPLTLALFVCLGALAAPRVVAQPALAPGELNETIDATVHLLKTAAQPHRDRRHQSLLLALRHLRDPELKPFFEHLLTLRSNEMRIHAILGLAESDPAHRLDLTRLAELPNPEAQIQTIMAAMDNSLFTDDDAAQLLAWQGVEPAVKEVIATQLVAAKKFNQPELLREGLASDNTGRAGLAAVLLTQLGDPAGRDALYNLKGPDHRTLDAVRMVLLGTIMRLELDRAAPWAMTLAQDPATPARQQQLALHVAMRFNVPGSVDRWQSLYQSAAGTAARIRLGLIALRVAPWTDPSVFDTLLRTEDDLLKAMGKTASAIASKGDVPATVRELLQTRSPIVNEWLALYLRDQAPPETAKETLLVWFEDWRQRPAPELTASLEHIISATQLMFDKDGQWASEQLRPVIARDDTPTVLIQGILMGLLRTRDDRAAAVLDGARPFNVELADNLALVVKVRHGAPLTDDETRRLALLVRGGGGMPASLRVQAGWALLKRLGRHQTALERAMQD